MDDPVVSSISFDAPRDPIPYEQRRVSDMTLFAQFGRRVLETIGPLVPHPLIERLWPLAVQAAREHGNLGRALAQARHIVEAEWGLASLELPLSEMCDDWPFRWFSAHLLGDAERLCGIHNDCLAEYRRVHKIRGHTHPVPDLTRHDEWQEVPFWLWSTEQPGRRPAFSSPRFAGRVERPPPSACDVDAGPRRRWELVRGAIGGGAPARRASATACLDHDHVCSTRIERYFHSRHRGGKV